MLSTLDHDTEPLTDLRRLTKLSGRDSRVHIHDNETLTELSRLQKTSQFAQIHI